MFFQVLDSFDAQVTDAINVTAEDIATLEDYSVSLGTAQDSVTNETTDLTTQQGVVSDSETAVGVVASILLNETENCDKANASLMQLQLRFDSLSVLSEEDITDVRNRLVMIESQLVTADIENMIMQLTIELDRQRNIVNILESEIDGITTERDLLRQVYNSLPQSCNDVV